MIHSREPGAVVLKGLNYNAGAMYSFLFFFFKSIKKRKKNNDSEDRSTSLQNTHTYRIYGERPNRKDKMLAASNIGKPQMRSDLYVSQARYHVDTSTKRVISPSACLLPDLKSGGGGVVSGNTGKRGLPRFTSVLQTLDILKATLGQSLVVLCRQPKSN